MRPITPFIPTRSSSSREIIQRGHREGIAAKGLFDQRKLPVTGHERLYPRDPGRSQDHAPICRRATEGFKAMRGAKPMVCALLIGRKGSVGFPGKNTHI